MALLAMGIAIALAMASRVPPSKKLRAVGDVRPEDLERLGPAVGSWLHRTRELSARMERLHDLARTMLAQEIEREGFPRNLHRQVQDANFFSEIRPVREIGRQWLEGADEFGEAERDVLAGGDIEPGKLAAHLELAWGTADEFDKKRDRSDEIQRIIESCAAAVPVLHRIDQTLSAASPPPYR